MNLFKEETTSMIPCTLGEAEIRQRGQELAGALEELEAIKDDKKRVAREFKEREENCSGRVAKLREIVKTGIEAIEQPCEKVYDVTASEIYWEYNGTKYHKREMRDDERGRCAGTLFDVPDSEEDVM